MLQYSIIDSVSCKFYVYSARMLIKYSTAESHCHVCCAHGLLDSKQKTQGEHNKIRKRNKMRNQIKLFKFKYKLLNILFFQ
jgi:hypothetical protein